MKLSVFLLLIIFPLLLNAQKKSTSTNKDQKEFKNQGEQEDYLTELFFARNYKEQSFRKFNGEIIVTNIDVYRYNNQVLILNNLDYASKTIFEKGLFYPEIITGKVILKLKTELDSLTMEKRALYNYINQDTLNISSFEELKQLNKTPQQRRFRFWLFRKGRLNPTVCFIELTNINATVKTDISAFIAGSTLTFHKEGWIII
ncbi:hypothetical protein FFF34_005555 [Inquilinus sp. KBS0705]|nr:hypothetical protein FFF34_005555 [Inquilinus sp. KBS0705]